MVDWDTWHETQDKEYEMEKARDVDGRHTPWRIGRPPHDTFVEVLVHGGSGEVAVAKGVWGDPDKGVKPHWKTPDGTCYDCTWAVMWR
jgi:hypothetical protein